MVSTTRGKDWIVILCILFIILSDLAIPSNYHQLWHDNMEAGAEWNVTGSASDEMDNCYIGTCVRIIEGTTIKRQYLSTQNYDNVRLTYSIKVNNLKYGQFCGVYYSTNGVDWTLLKKYTEYVNDQHHYNQIIDLPYHTYNNPNIQIRFTYSSPTITALNLNGSCFIDEIYLHGTPKQNVAIGTKPEVIWYDNMESGNGWYFENTSDHTTNCYIGDCVQMSGNAYIERDGLSTKNYKNIQLKYSIKPMLLESDESCNVYYSVDNQQIIRTDWKLIGEYNQFFNDEYQINEVLDLPLDADNNGNIQIKFNLTQNFDKYTMNENRNKCFVDEVYLLGIKQIVMNHGYIYNNQILVAILTYQLFF